MLANLSAELPMGSEEDYLLMLAAENTIGGTSAAYDLIF